MEELAQECLEDATLKMLFFSSRNMVPILLKRMDSFNTDVRHAVEDPAGIFVCNIKMHIHRWIDGCVCVLCIYTYVVDGCFIAMYV